MLVAGIGSAGRGQDGPGVGQGVVACAVAERLAVVASPNDHLAAGPDSGVPRAWRGCVQLGHGLPAVRGRLVASAVPQDRPGPAAPDDELCSGPHEGCALAGVGEGAKLARIPGLVASRVGAGAFGRGQRGVERARCGVRRGECLAHPGPPAGFGFLGPGVSLDERAAGVALQQALREEGVLGLLERAETRVA